MKIKFTVNTDPHPQYRPYTLDYNPDNEPEYIKAYKEKIKKSARIAMGDNPPTSKPVGVYVAICRTKDPDDKYFGDIDNHLKIIFDTLKGICYTDDRLIRGVQSFKHYGEHPHIRIAITDQIEGREEIESSHTFRSSAEGNRNQSAALLIQLQHEGYPSRKTPARCIR